MSTVYLNRGRMRLSAVFSFKKETFLKIENGVLKMGKREADGKGNIPSVYYNIFTLKYKR